MARSSTVCCLAILFIFASTSAGFSQAPAGFTGEQGGLVGVGSLANVDVAFALTSARESVAPGELVSWQIQAWVQGRDNLGLAMFSVDVEPGSANPEPIALLAADGAPAQLAVFDLPQGYANRGAERGSSAYGGTAVPRSGGSVGLIQIGGAQNTFGVAGPCFGNPADVCVGQNTQVTTGVGHSPRGTVVAAGTFSAPTQPGAYELVLSGLMANVIEDLREQGGAIVRAARVLAAPPLRFVVEDPR